MHIPILPLSYRGIELKQGLFVSKTKTLCDSCANPCCSDFAAKECRDFVPVIKFRPPIRGFSGRFNTFRMGNVWAKRASPGVIMGLANAKTEEIFGYAKVTEVHTGPKQDLAKLFALDNHNIRALEITENVAEVMLRRLKNSSGTRAYNATDVATVIYMEMIQL